MNDNHRVLHKLLGKWKLRADFDFSHAGPQFLASGTLTAVKVFEGRYVQMTISAMYAGQPAEIIRVFGYDVITKQFNIAQYDNKGPGIVNWQATWDPITQTLHEVAMVSNPLLGTQHAVHATLQFIEAGVIIYRTMVPQDNGKLVQTMEARYDRIGEAA